MDKYALASKLVTGVVAAIVVNKITPHVESSYDAMLAKVKKDMNEKTK